MYGLFVWLVEALSGVASMPFYMTITTAVVMYWITQALAPNLIMEDIIKIGGTGTLRICVTTLLVVSYNCGQKNVVCAVTDYISFARHHTWVVELTEGDRKVMGLHTE